MFYYQIYLHPIDESLSEEESATWLTLNINEQVSKSDAEVVSIFQSQKFYKVLYRVPVPPDKEEETIILNSQQILTFLEKQAKKKKQTD